MKVSLGERTAGLGLGRVCKGGLEGCSVGGKGRFGGWKELGREREGKFTDDRWGTGIVGGR